MTDNLWKIQPPEWCRPHVNAAVYLGLSDNEKRAFWDLPPIDGELLAGEPWPLTEGRKDDGGKVRMELLPPELMTAVADILTFGAQKYEDRNWEKGMAWSRVYGALLRHLNAWWAGEQNDAETSKSHLWHAGCCLAFLIAYEARGTGTDDRPQNSA